MNPCPSYQSNMSWCPRSPSVGPGFPHGPTGPMLPFPPVNMGYKPVLGMGYNVPAVPMYYPQELQPMPPMYNPQELQLMPVPVQQIQHQYQPTYNIINNINYNNFNNY